MLDGNMLDANIPVGQRAQIMREQDSRKRLQSRRVESEKADPDPVSACMANIDDYDRLTFPRYDTFFTPDSFSWQHANVLSGHLGDEEKAEEEIFRATG